MFARADDMEEGRTAGDAFSIYQSLAVQGVPEAQYVLGNIYTDRREPIQSQATGLRWYRQAIARGHPAAMYNLAINCRNLGDLGGYRFWLARAAQIDPESRPELKQFRIRFPHSVMRRWRRYAAER